MNRAEFVNEFAEKSAIPKAKAETLVLLFGEVVMEALASGGDVKLMGFGAFVPKRREAREGRNPSTGAPIKIAAKNNVVFRASKEFLDRINK